MVVAGRGRLLRGPNHMGPRAADATPSGVGLFAGNGAPADV